MTPTQRYITYVINYNHTLKNHISESSVHTQSIEAALNTIQSIAINAIYRINNGDITKMSEVIDACSAMGDVFMSQLCEDMDYTYLMNETALQQREGHELPY